MLREEPFAHLYEMWNRAAAGGSGACGARVALDGYGGDQLFLVTECYLADLARRGKWITLAREWNAKRGKGLGLRDFFRWVIQPVLPQPLLNAAAMLRSLIRFDSRGRLFSRLRAIALALRGPPAI